MENPLVSVIIPNYCHSKYLEQRIESVLGQTYQNFEMIILDDASPDDGASRAVIEKYRDNPHVVHIEYNEVNSGSTFKQWRKGFELAQGELIWIAESDDYCELNFLETCVTAYLKASNVAYVYATSILVDEQSSGLDWLDIAEKIPEGIFDGVEFIKCYMCVKNGVWNASAVIMNREKALSVPQQYLQYKSAGDYLFWILMAEQGKVIHLNKHLNFFRQHEFKVTPRMHRIGISHLEELEVIKYIKSKGWLSLDQECKIFNIYIREIYWFKYEDAVIRKKVLRKWVVTNPILALFELSIIYYGMFRCWICNKLERI